MVTLKRKDVLETLSQDEMFMGELVLALQQAHEGLDEDEIKSVVLPLLASREIVLTTDRKLKAIIVPAGAAASV